MDWTARELPDAFAIDSTRQPPAVHRSPVRPIVRQYGQNHESQSTSDAIVTLIQARKFAGQAGGIDQAQKALAALARLG